MKPLWRWPFTRRLVNSDDLNNAQSRDANANANANANAEAKAEASINANATSANATSANATALVAKSATSSTRSSFRSSLATAGLRPHSLPRPALRWLGDGGRVALREFDFARDADTICSWQQETYSVNFPDFRYTDGFASAFRHDLRRGSLDPNHAVFVLDEASSVIGFLWLVICENTWTGERYGYVNNVYLVAPRRGQGLAREMMSHAERWFRSRGIKRARLTVTSSNAVACKLYQQCGYNTTRWEMEKEL